MGLRCSESGFLVARVLESMVRRASGATIRFRGVSKRRHHHYHEEHDDMTTQDSPLVAAFVADGRRRIPSGRASGTAGAMSASSRTPTIRVERNATDGDTEIVMTAKPLTDQGSCCFRSFRRIGAKSSKSVARRGRAACASFCSRRRSPRTPRYSSTIRKATTCTSAGARTAARSWARPSSRTSCRARSRSCRRRRADIPSGR